MSLAVAFSATATLVAGAFAMFTLERWTRRRRRHDGAWTVALVMFVIASGGLWAGLATEWSNASYRVFYLFGAALNVPVLALGTLYLLGSKRVVDRIALMLAVWCGVATGIVLATPLRGDLPAEGLPHASDHFGALPRVVGVAGSSIGALVLVGGAVWSVAQLVTKQRAPANGVSGRRMVSANLCIAVGTVVLGLGGSRFEDPTAFSVTTAVGITTIFAGFLITQLAPGEVADPLR